MPRIEQLRRTTKQVWLWTEAAAEADFSAHSSGCGRLALLLDGYGTESIQLGAAADLCPEQYVVIFFDGAIEQTAAGPEGRRSNLECGKQEKRLTSERASKRVLCLVG